MFRELDIVFFYSSRLLFHHFLTEFLRVFRRRHSIESQFARFAERLAD